MDSVVTASPELEMLRQNKEGGYNYRERRQEDWRENYTLYRDKVTLNRLTQRQSVNIPLMKGSIKTLLKDVDDMPVLYFENLDNDKEAEVFENEFWKRTLEENNGELLDIVDKRQVFMFGRSFIQLQIINGKVSMIVQDPQDILVSRFTDPMNLHSSRFLIHTHIFKPLSELMANEDYDEEALQALKNFHQTDQGLDKAGENLQMLEEKNKKMRDMGITDIDDPVLGETYVEISLHFIFRNSQMEGEGDEAKEAEGDQIYLYVEADEQQVLMKKPLEEVIGKTEDNYWRTHYPYSTWADELEKQDFWTDGVADVIRTPNKILNSWFSQMVENRTLKNFGMNYYDSNMENFNPNTFNARPWGWYPIPGDPNKTIKRVEVGDLSESLPEIQFVINFVEKASGATTTQQGEVQAKQVTLGEIELALTEAKERVKGMSKFYTPAWKERGEMFLKLIEAGHEKLDAVKIYKEGRNTKKIFSREIEPADWMTKAGYRVKVWSQDEKDTKDTNALQKLSGAKQIMPNNPVVDEEYKRKYLEFTGFSPDKTNEAMEWEQEQKEFIDQQLAEQGGQAGLPNPDQFPPDQTQQPLTL